MAIRPPLAPAQSAAERHLSFKKICVRPAEEVFRTTSVRFAVNPLALMIKISTVCAVIIIGKL